MKALIHPGVLLALALSLPATVAPAGAQRLVVWMVGDDKTPQVLQPAVQAYRAQHPGVDIEVREIRDDRSGNGQS